MSARGEPPDKDVDRLPREPADIEEVVTSHYSTPHTITKRTGDAFHGSRINRRSGCDTPPRWRYSDAWRSGFTAGAIDALRLLCREVDDPAVWTACHHLSAGGSDD